MNKEIDLVALCDECGSEFLKTKSKSMTLCPECSHIIMDMKIAVISLKTADAFSAFGTEAEATILNL